MSPSASLMKNGLMLLVLGLLIKYHKGWQFRRSAWVLPALLLATIVLPFILFALPGNQPDWLSKGSYRLNMGSLYAPGKADAPKVDVPRANMYWLFLVRCALIARWQAINCT